MRPFLLAAALGLAAPANAQSQDEIEFAQRVLGSLQEPSFAANREYCGTIGITAEGRLVASQARRGGRDGCRPRDPQGAAEIIASYHTHAAYEPDADSELPSVDDVYSDMDEGIDGYLATPGGRFWFIDGQTGSVRQICGAGCLPSDPSFVPGQFGTIRKRYTLDQLEDRSDRY